MILLEIVVSTLLNADACRLEPIISRLSSNVQRPLDSGFNVCFPHNVLVLHHYGMETSWFSLMMHESPSGKTCSPRVLLGENVLLCSPRARENAL
jgi:hypothetical protein